MFIFNSLKILGGKIEWPMSIDPVPKNLIEKLLEPEIQVRLTTAQVQHLINLKNNCLSKLINPKEFHKRVL